MNSTERKAKTTHRHRHLALANRFKDSRCALQRAIATDAEQNIVLVIANALNDGFDLKATCANAPNTLTIAQTNINYWS